MWLGSSKSLHEVPLSVSLVQLEMDHLALIIIAILQLYQKCLEGAPVDSTVKLANGMTLQCVYPKTAIISQMSWLKTEGNSKETIAVFKLPLDVHMTSKYEGRAHVVNHTRNNKSLVFSNTTEADAGFYLCSFQTFPDGIWEKRIQVVESGDFEPLVLPAVYVTTGPGSNLNFTCWHDPQIAVHRVIWEKVQADCVDFVAQCVQSDHPVYGSDYQDRVEVHCGTQGNSTMILQNVTAFDSGIYRCRYIGANGKTTMDWTKLMVNSNVPLDNEQNVFFIAGGAAVITLLLMIVLAIVVTILHCRKRKRKKVMMRKALHTTQKQACNRCGRTEFHGTRNASRENNAKAFGPTMNAIYENSRDLSPMLNMGV